jgi:MtfA peptidase
MVLNDKAYCIPWLNLIREKMNKMKTTNLGINTYGSTNKQEFLAVAGEYFFEQPHLLKSHHPVLYKMLTQAFNQDPTMVLRARKQSVIPIGRNDLCPCGSGLKYKKCCLTQ